jgi:hypothetical protein
MLRNADGKAVDALLVDAKTVDDKAVGARVDADTADEKAIGALGDADTADDKAGDAPSQMPIPPGSAKLCRPGRCQARQRQSYYWHGTVLLVAMAADDEEIAALADAKTAKKRSCERAALYSQALKDQ